MYNILKIATAEIGVKETPGKKATPRIIDYAHESGFTDYKSDEVAWCSIFLNWAAMKAGLGRSELGTARSWLNHGTAVENPEPGDIVVFWRESRDSWKGHVGIFMGFSKDHTRVYCLGGNQGDQVSITAQLKSKVLGYRRLQPDVPLSFDKKLSLNDTGVQVAKLQDALKQLGYDCGTSDGIFGPKTETALKDFQSTNRNLSMNGIFDQATRAYMSEILTNE